MKACFFLLLSLLSVSASILFSFKPHASPLQPGLDYSWTWAISYGAVNGFRWGRDFVFTYGPYGYLITKMDVGNLASKRAIFDLLMLGGSGVACAAYVQSISGLRKNPKLTLLVLILLAYTLSIQWYEYKWFGFFLLVLLLSLTISKRSALIGFAIAGMLSGFYLLIKLSLGISALITMIVASFLKARPLLVMNRLGIASSAAVASFMILWFTSGGILDDIPSYLTTGWELTKGYSAAMSLKYPYWWIEVGSFVSFFILLIIWTLWYLKNRLVLALLSFPLFAVWKHAIVRQDNHVLILTLFGLFVVLILSIHSISILKWSRIFIFAGISVILLIIPSLNNPVVHWPKLKYHLIRPIAPMEIGKFWVHIYNLPGQRQNITRISQDKIGKVLLPNSIRSIIGSSSIDIYPWELSFVPANNLNWSNRPLPASYSAYTPTLDNINAGFFAAKQRRPEYLLWHHVFGMSSIDGRHLFFDEPHTLRSILDNYDLVFEDNDISLFHVRPVGRFVAPNQIGIIKSPWDIWIEVPHLSGMLMATVTFEPNLAMRVIQQAGWVNKISLSLRFSSGEEITYRFVPDNASSGLWINPFPVTVDEFRSLSRGGPARRVVGVKFEGGPLSKLYSEITIAWLQFNISDLSKPIIKAAPIVKSEIPDWSLQSLSHSAWVCRKQVVWISNCGRRS